MEIVTLPIYASKEEVSLKVKLQQWLWQDGSGWKAQSSEPTPSALQLALVFGAPAALVHHSALAELHNQTRTVTTLAER